MSDPCKEILDELLVLRCQEGSRKAYELLIKRWQPRLWHHAFRLTGHPDAAWDVIQESWVAVVKGLARLNDVTLFRRWIYTIVTRKAADWQRRRYRRREINLDQSGAEDRAVGPSDDANASDDRAVLHSAISQLRGEHQVLLALRYLEGFTDVEMADILGVPNGTVRSRLHDARSRLREILERIKS